MNRKSNWEFNLMIRLKFRYVILVLALIGAFVSVQFLVQLIVFLVFQNGVVTEGAHRRIEIGMDRWDLTNLYLNDGSLKILGYQENASEVCYIGMDDSCSNSFEDSDSFLIKYHTWYEEVIYVHLDNDHVSRITYQRSLLGIDT